MDNAITRACQTGFWLLYDNIGYNTASTCLSIDIDTCSDLGSCSKPSSLRFAGSPYVFNEPYFNLYHGEAYTGEEFAGNRTTSSIGDMVAYSIIITGVDSWTLFEGSDFTGFRVCAVPDQVYVGADGTVINYGEFFMLYELNLRYINSLKQGCHSDTVVSAKAVKDKREKEAIGGK
ncbi:uncharacterized protein LOC108681212 [Hyalella azteca]|uniref:Uncharacterized protein LOC108681212 n=1 Tax=Hyalella azteca TaxID=294128 RepID=A0A8B7PHR8_HYAAZ|nr:uncharacterized protein LOC108681212 [Hyalella azteca]